MASNDAKGTLEKSQKRDVRKRCGARRICRMVGESLYDNIRFDLKPPEIGYIFKTSEKAWSLFFFN